MKICSCDTFDLAFDILKGHIKQLPYSTESRLLAVVFRNAWKKSSKKFMAQIKDSFDLSGEGFVDRKKQKDLTKLGKAVGKAMVKRIRPKTLAVFSVVVTRAIKEFDKRMKNVKKPVKPNKFGKDKKLLKDDEEFITWLEFMQGASMVHVENFIEIFPERILLPEVEKLTKLFEINPSTREIDLFVLKERLAKFPNRPAHYFDNLSDIYVGRQWRFTGLEMMWETGFSSYQIISQGDKKTCPVCQRLHGRIFSVPLAKAKMDTFLSLNNPDAMAQHYKFPRVSNEAWRAWRANQ